MKNNFSIIYKSLVYVSFYFIIYILFLNQGLKTDGPLGIFFADTYGHAFEFSARYLHENWFQMFQRDFEPLTHIPVAIVAYLFKLITGNSEYLNLVNAAAFVLSFAKLAEFIVTKWILNRCVSLTETQSFFIAIVINFCTIPYLPFLILNMYIPMGTPNLWHNPPNIMLTPFAVLFFYLYVSSRKKKIDYKYAFFLSGLLVITTLIKPSFTYMIVLTVAISYLFDVKRFLCKHFINDLIIYVPATLISLLQSYLISVDDRGGGIVFAPFKVIYYYTTHPIYALLQAIEFPLLITIIYFLFKKEDFRDNFDYMKFSWILGACAYLLFALFSFTNHPFAANLMWPFLVSLTLLYVFSIIECIKLFQSYTSNQSAKKLFVLQVCAFNLAFIFISGIHQFVKLYIGGSYI